VVKATSTRARPKSNRKLTTNQHRLVRFLNLLQVGLAAGVGAMLDELLSGEPHLGGRNVLQ
jgi:hypothetical protein